MKYRTEKDTLGNIDVPIDAYWGAQTERSRMNFKIGEHQQFPFSFIRMYALLKKSAASTNAELGVLQIEIAALIEKAATRIINGEFEDQFPLVIWQTGSGTQTNMNLNEVIANLGHVINGGRLSDPSKPISPNDHVNKSQSSNDSFPTVMYMHLYHEAITRIIPSVERLETELSNKVSAFNEIVKIGRTHMMDAVPISLAQEFSAFYASVHASRKHLELLLQDFLELPIGGTAVGTGLNTPQDFDTKIVEHISKETNYEFRVAPNKFDKIANHNDVVRFQGELNNLAMTLHKMLNDIRMMASGPRAGLNELILPANEPGSSIMPGKINPTQIEALLMVCAQIMGNTQAVNIGGMNGQFQLNVYKPLLVMNVHNSIRLMANAIDGFIEHCLKGLEANLFEIKAKLDRSLMLVTALNPKIGYYKAAEIAQNAFNNGTSLKVEAVKSGYLTAEEFDLLVDPMKMI